MACKAPSLAEMIPARNVDFLLYIPASIEIVLYSFWYQQGPSRAESK